MDSHWQKVKSILADVLDRPAHERESAARNACGDDDVLLDEVDRLLQREQDADKFFATPILGNMTTAPAIEAPIDCTGMQIGPFEVMKEIGSGGMGTVYEAVQHYPRRTVALKVLRSGLASTRAFERFRHEANVVARMRHPGIAQIYDAGIHQHVSGAAPYFAMEYIEAATTLTRHAEKHSLSTTDRLHLFDQVCEAVQYGHQRGVIHRDLKPENILVDSDGRAKVIDFGIARSTDADLAAATRATGAGDLMGTLRYMSPEQCRGDAADLDVRTDVYSLGVTLFQLLTGEHPYDIGDTTPFEIPRIIRDVEPKKLSSINASFRGDLDTIVSKALEKDRDRRYASVTELADDLRRFLHHEPVHARPATKIYRLRKFARRNRVLVAAGTAVLLMLLAATAVSAGFALRESRAARAELEQRETAEEVTRFLTELIYAADPNLAKGDEITVREVLDNAGLRIGSELSDRPVVEAAIRMVIGQTYWRLGHRDLAELHLRRSVELRRSELGNDDEQTLDATNALALVLQETGQLDEATSLYTLAFDGFERLFGEDHAKTILLLNNLGWLSYQRGELENAENCFRQALDRRRRLGLAEDLESIRTTINLANVLRDLDRPEQAGPLYRRAVESAREALGADDTFTAYALGCAADFLRGRGELKQAASYARIALEQREKVLGPDHLYTAYSRQTLARVLELQEQYDEAGVLYEDAHEVIRSALGVRHADTYFARSLLIGFYYRRGRITEYRELAHDLLETLRATVGDDHLETLDTLNGYGYALSLHGEWERAQEVFQAEYDRRNRQQGENDPLTLRAKLNLANCFVVLGHCEQAEQMLRDVYEIRRARDGDKDWGTISARSTLGESLACLERFDEAELLQRSALDDALETIADDAEFVARIRLQLGRTLLQRGSFAEAERMLLDGLAGYRTALAEGHPLMRRTVKELIELYELSNQPEQAVHFTDLLTSWESGGGES